jgi:hypothetical protein
LLVGVGVDLLVEVVEQEVFVLVRVLLSPLEHLIQSLLVPVVPVEQMLVKMG